MGKELEGKVLKWNYVRAKCFGFLKIEEFPHTPVLIHRNQFVGDVTQEKLVMGVICRFTVNKNKKGQYQGRDLTIVWHDDHKNSLNFEFTTINPEAMSMIDTKDIAQVNNSVNFFQTLPIKHKTNYHSSVLKASSLAPEDGRSDTKSVFVDTIDRFCSTQFSHLVADLYSNTCTEKGDAVHAQKVVSNFNNAATYFLYSDTSPKSLSLDVILELHRLATDQVLESAGILRHNRGARAGRNRFPSPSQVLPLLKMFLDLFQSYLQSFFLKYFNEGDTAQQIREFNGEAVRDACTLAAWAGYHYVKIHPFNDGNGRTVCTLL